MSAPEASGKGQLFFETVNVRQEGAVLFVEISAPPMNLLGPALVRDLVSLIQLTEANDVYQVLVFKSADPDYFISHVDVTRIKEKTQYKSGGPRCVSIVNNPTHLDQGAHMSTIHFKKTTTSTPEQFIAGLTDFGPGRSKLFGNSTDQYLKVHQKGSVSADVTEGSGGIWERLHYDWSDPRHIVLTTTDSNLWGGHSGHTYTLARQPNGTTDLDVVIVREGKNFKGRMLGLFLGIIGKGVLEKAFANSLKAIEAQNYGVSAAAKTHANKS